jgi:hypothetical protein
VQDRGQCRNDRGRDQRRDGPGQRVSRGADAKTLMAVLRALKGQRGSWVGAKFGASTHARHPGRQINLQPKSGYPVKSAISRKKAHKSAKSAQAIES